MPICFSGYNLFDKKSLGSGVKKELWTTKD